MEDSTVLTIFISALVIVAIIGFLTWKQVKKTNRDLLRDVEEQVKLYIDSHPKGFADSEITSYIEKTLNKPEVDYKHIRPFLAKDISLKSEIFKLKRSNGERHGGCEVWHKVEQKTKTNV